MRYKSIFFGMGIGLCTALPVHAEPIDVWAAAKHLYEEMKGGRFIYESENGMIDLTGLTSNVKEELSKSINHEFTDWKERFSAKFLEQFTSDGRSLKTLLSDPEHYKEEWYRALEPALLRLYNQNVWR